jgi:hypothetical protein
MGIPKEFIPASVVMSNKKSRIVAFQSTTGLQASSGIKVAC